MKLTLLQLRSFLALADALSFTVAADRLHIRQSTLSSTIRNLESSLGGRLFDRDTHRVQLTSLGQECKRLATRLLDEADRIEVELRRYVLGERGSLRLAALPNIFPTLLSGALAEFRATHPGVALQFADVTGDEALALLRHGQVDLAISYALDEARDLRFQLLDEQRLVALLPEQHPLASLDSIAWRDVLSEPLIIVQSRDSVGERVAQALSDAGLKPRIDHRVNELSSAVGLLEAGFGIALMGHHTAEHALRPGLTIRNLKEPAITGRVCVITLASTELTAPLRALCETLLTFAAPRRAWGADGSAPQPRAQAG